MTYGQTTNRKNVFRSRPIYVFLELILIIKDATLCLFYGKHFSSAKSMQLPYYGWIFPLTRTLNLGKQTNAKLRYGTMLVGI